MQGFLIALFALLGVFFPLPNFLYWPEVNEWIQRVAPALLDFVKLYGGWDTVVTMLKNASDEDLQVAMELSECKCSLPTQGIFKGDGSFLKALVEAFIKLAPLFFKMAPIAPETVAVDQAEPGNGVE